MYGYLRVVFLFFKVVKSSESPKALYKFPIVINMSYAGIRFLYMVKAFFGSNANYNFCLRILQGHL